MSELPDWVFGRLLPDLNAFGHNTATMDDCSAAAALAGHAAHDCISSGTCQDEWWRVQTVYLFSLVRWHITGEARWRNLYAEFPPPSGAGRVLDFGCGIGTHTLALSAMGWVADGIDLGERMIDFAQWRADYHDSGARFAVGNAPMRGEYDFIMMHDVVGHLTKPHATMGAVDDALKGGGGLYITYNNAQESAAQQLHRNAEIDFPAMLESMGLERESTFVWRKPA